MATAALSAEAADSTAKPSGRVSATLRSPLGIAAGAGLVILLILAIIGPIIWAKSAESIDVNAIGQPPSWHHLFGTDAGGRDVLERVLVATRLSVLMALAATAIGIVLGTLLGCLPSVVGVRLGRLITAAVNLAVAFPGLLLAIFFSVIFGQSAWGAVLAIGLAGAPTFGRLTQTMSASVAGRDFVAAARVLGVPRRKVLTRHVLPNIREQLIVVGSLAAGGALIAFAGLSYLGLGVQAPAYDWGRLLNDGLNTIYTNPATALAPGGAVVLSGIAFVMFGEAVARASGIERRPLGWLPKLRFGGGSPAPSDPDTVLSVRNLRVAVPGPGRWNYPVDGVSFDIRRGEKVGIVGESGSGKSLTVTAVSALLEEPLRVAADRVTFDGVELTRRGQIVPRRLSRRVARHLGTRLSLVFQDPTSSLNPAVRVGPQVAEIGILHGGLNRREARERALQRLDEVRIPDPPRRARQYPHELSGGMRQRAMIAMGIMGTPSLIIADEATTNLDVTVQLEVLRLLGEVTAENRSSLLLISHDIAVVTGVCSRMLVMYRGHLVEDISVADVIAGRARHPYTRALLAAVPSMRSERGAPLPTIPEGTQFDTAPVDVAPIDTAAVRTGEAEALPAGAASVSRPDPDRGER